MKKAFSKKKLIILIIVLALAAAAVAAGLLLRKGKGGGVHVETVASIMGGSDAEGDNRYAGVVEAEKSWSVKTTAGSSVAEVLVKVGDSVKKGDALFKYDTDKINDSLAQAEIDLQRLQNEKKSANETIAELTREKAAASAQDQGDYTLQIQEQQLEVSETETEIKTKEAEIKKLQKSAKNTVVKSEIDGIVKSINNGESGGDELDDPFEDVDMEDTSEEDIDGTETAFMTILQTKPLRIKATVNEQNIAALQEGIDVTVYSRVDDSTWKGTISRIDYDNAQQGEQDEDMFMDEETDEETSSSSYPFYVDLESSDGLMLGQHVFIQATGAGAGSGQEGVWLDEAYLVGADGDNPYVWADNGKGKLTKKSVEIGDYNEELMAYEITDGLTKEDRITMPKDSLKKGMKTR